MSDDDFWWTRDLNDPEHLWGRLEKDPEFRAGMELARADYEAGRFSRFVHRVERPTNGLLARLLTVLAKASGCIWFWYRDERGRRRLYFRRPLR